MFYTHQLKTSARKAAMISVVPKASARCASLWAVWEFCIQNRIPSPNHPPPSSAHLVPPGLTSVVRRAETRKVLGEYNMTHC